MVVGIGRYLSLGSSCKIISRHQFLVNIIISLLSTHSTPTTQVQLKKRCAGHQMSQCSITTSSSRVKVTPSREAEQLHAYTQQSMHLSNHPLHVKQNSYTHTPSSPCIWAITQSFLLHLYTISSLHSIQLRQAIKICPQILKIPATVSCSEKNDFPTNPPWLPSGRLPMMSITQSTTWLAISADQTFGYTRIIQYFMVTNHLIIPNIFPPSNPMTLRVILQLLYFQQFLLVHGPYPPSPRL
jgi:hypothetical protein